MPRWAETDAGRAAEHAARTAYGRLVATLTRASGDVGAAEDALADAFAAALGNWPAQGVPAAPEAWLLTTARRRLTDRARRAVTARAGEVTLSLIEEARMDVADPDLPDPRLGLLFLCAHPGIDRSVHTPLMLQTVLGLDAKRIANVFLVSPQAMSQRLVRAKAKIRSAGIPFGVPDRDAWQPRLTAVLDAIYAAYTSAYAEAEPPAVNGLVCEAEWLARLVAELLPYSGEANGLLALLLFSLSRAQARRSADGAYVPLSEQDTALWDSELILEACEVLEKAARCDDGGPYQIEAAIQSVHAARAVTGKTDHRALLTLYDGLMRVAPSLGAAIARAAVLGEVDGPAAGLAALDVLDGKRLDSHLPYWATRGHLLQADGQAEAAKRALERAASLAGDAATRDWLRARILP